MLMDDMELSPTCSDFSSSPTPSFSTSHPPSPISCTTSSISASTSFTTFPNYTTSQPQQHVTPSVVAAPTTPKNKFCESASRIDGREGGHKRQKSFRAQQIHSPRSSPSSTSLNSVSINSISISFGQAGAHASPSPPPSSSSALASGLNNGALLAGTAKLLQSVPGQGAHNSNVRQMSPILQVNAAASIPAGGNVVKATANLLLAQGGIPTLPIASIEPCRPRRSTTPPPPPPPPQQSTSALPISPPPPPVASKEAVIVTVHMPHTARESSSSDMAIEPSISRQRSRKNSISSNKKSGSQTARDPVKKKKVKKSTPDKDEAALMASLIASGLMTGGGGGSMFGSPTPDSPLEEKDKGPQNSYIDSAYELPFTPPAPRPFGSFVPEGAMKVPTSSWLKSVTKPHLTPAAIVKNALGNTTLLEGPLSPRHSPIVAPRSASMIVVPINGAKSPTLVSNLSNSSSPNLSPLLLPQNPASVLNSELRQVISGHSAGYLLFLRHLQREYASESLMFWKAIEDFLPLAAKHLSSELERLQQQTASGSPNPSASASDPSVYGPGFGTIYLTLYDMFIKTGSKMEINISSHLRELLKKDAVQHQKIRAELLGTVDPSAISAPAPGPSPRTSPIPFPVVASPNVPPPPPPIAAASVTVPAPGSRSNSTDVPPPPPPPPQSNSNSPASSTKSLASMLAPPSPGSGVALPALTPPPPIPPRPSKAGLNLNHISIVKDEVAQMEGATLVQNPLVCNSAPSAPVTAAIPAASYGSKYSTLPINWMQGQPASRSHGHQPSVTEMIHLDEMKLDGPAVRRGSVPCQNSSGAVSPVMPPVHLPPRIALSLSTYSHLFDAQAEIEKLLTHDCLPRFKQTPLYERWKRLDALAATSTKESNSGSTTSRISGRLSWLH